MGKFTGWITLLAIGGTLALVAVIAMTQGILPANLLVLSSGQWELVSAVFYIVAIILYLFESERHRPGTLGVRMSLNRFNCQGRNPEAREGWGHRLSLRPAYDLRVRRRKQGGPTVGCNSRTAGGRAGAMGKYSGWIMLFAMAGTLSSVAAIAIAEAFVSATLLVLTVGEWELLAAIFYILAVLLYIGEGGLGKGKKT